MAGAELTRLYIELRIGYLDHHQVARAKRSVGLAAFICLVFVSYAGFVQFGLKSGVERFLAF